MSLRLLKKFPYLLIATSQILLYPTTLHPLTKTALLYRISLHLILPKPFPMLILPIPVLILPILMLILPILMLILPILIFQKKALSRSLLRTFLTMQKIPKP